MRPTDAFGTTPTTNPRWNGMLLVNYATGPFSTTFELTANSKSQYSATSVGPDDPQYYQTVTSAACPGGTTTAPTQCPWYMVASNSISKNVFGGAANLNWSAQYSFDIQNVRLTTFVGINNVFDREPSHFIPSSGGTGDVIGRTYRAGARFAF